MVGGHVKNILEEKGTAVLTIAPDATVYDCIATMVDANVGSAVVVEEERVVGIFTERDYLRRIVLKGRRSPTTRVRDVMTPDVIAVTPLETVQRCLALMTRARCRHLPVLKDDKLCGIVSIGDCVKHISRDALEEVNHLQHYIQQHVADRYPA